jgi:hypothetical protein
MRTWDRYCSSATTRFSRPIMLRGMFLSFSLASSWTMTSQALGSFRAK